MNVRKIVNMFDTIIPQDDGQFKIGHVLSAYHKKKNVRFIEVGANDGIKDDPIYKWATMHDWEGILIEPVKSAFKLLCKNYSNFSKMTPINVAVSTEVGTVTMFVNKNKTGVASLYKKHPPNGGSKKVTVSCVTLDKVIMDNNFENFDLLQIDAEGHDFEVLKSINLSKYTPDIIHYEHRHLSSEDLKDCDDYLREFGYIILKNRNNTIGVLNYDKGA